MPLVSCGESRGLCTWPGLSRAGCEERFSKLITGCYVQLYIILINSVMNLEIRFNK